MGRGNSGKSRIETLIGNCNHFLSVRDFASSRKFALAALESDPGLPEAAQALAISNVLFAADRRFPNDRLDYYSILQVRPAEFESRRSVFAQFKKLLKLLNPSKNKFPFCRDAFDLVFDAWSVLSKPEKKQQYDLEIETCAANRNSPVNRAKTETLFRNISNRGDKDEEEQKEGIPNGEKCNLKETKGTFWTVCPYCYCLYEYEKEFRECSLKCQNCRRGFHAVELGPLPPSLVADGKVEYYCAIGYFVNGYPWDGFFDPKKENPDQCDPRMDNVVEPADDSRDDYDEKTKTKVECGETGGRIRDPKTNTEHGVLKEETLRAEGERVQKNVNPVLVTGRLNGKRVKSVAVNTKKGRKRFRTTRSACRRLDDDDQEG